MRKTRLAAILLAGAVAAATFVGGGGAAYAESAPHCSSTVQIGTTAHITVSGQTFASVKQFKGCGKNWAYLYVWQGYRDTHSSWSACVSIATVPSSGHRVLEDLVCSTKKTETWSSGANTLADCTVAAGMYGDDPLEPTVGWIATSIRC